MRYFYMYKLVHCWNHISSLLYHPALKYKQHQRLHLCKPHSSFTNTTPSDTHAWNILFLKLCAHQTTSSWPGLHEFAYDKATFLGLSQKLIQSFMFSRVTLAFRITCFHWKWLMILFQQNCYFCTTVHPAHRTHTSFSRILCSSQFSWPEGGCSDLITCHLGVQTDFIHGNQNPRESYLAVSTKKCKVEFIITLYLSQIIQCEYK